MSCLPAAAALCSVLRQWCTIAVYLSERITTSRARNSASQTEHDDVLIFVALCHYTQRTCMLLCDHYTRLTTQCCLYCNSDRLCSFKIAVVRNASHSSYILVLARKLLLSLLFHSVTLLLLLNLHHSVGFHATSATPRCNHT
jgi:hypothetical protein